MSNTPFMPQPSAPPEEQNIAPYAAYSNPPPPGPNYAPPPPNTVANHPYPPGNYSQPTYAPNPPQHYPGTDTQSDMHTFYPGTEADTHQDQDQGNKSSLRRSLTRLGNNTGMQTDYNDRNGFIKKVYVILCLQLAFTALITGITVSSSDIQEWMRVHWYIALMFMLVTLVIVIALFCFRSNARKVPLNYILLSIFTICEAYIVAYISSASDPTTVLLAFCLTLAATIGLTIYAWTTKNDFTMCGGAVWSLAVLLLFFAIFCSFYYNHIINLIICLVCIAIYCIFIVYDTQLIAGGRYNQLSYDDYILGAMMLYIDVIGLFLYILALLGKR